MFVYHSILYMISIEKIKNSNCDNEGIFYTSKYPLISCGFNSYYHSIIQQVSG